MEAFDKLRPGKPRRGGRGTTDVTTASGDGRPDLAELALAHVIGEEAVVADLRERARQQMLAEPAYEGLDRQGLVLDRAALAAIAPAERDALAVEAVHG